MKLEITKEKVLKASEKFTYAKEVLEELFPDVFEVEEEKWSRVTRDLKVSHSWQHPGDFCFDDGEDVIFWGTIKIIKSDAKYDVKIKDGEIYTRKRN